MRNGALVLLGILVAVVGVELYGGAKMLIAQAEDGRAQMAQQPFAPSSPAVEANPEPERSTPYSSPRRMRLSFYWPRF